MESLRTRSPFLSSLMMIKVINVSSFNQIAIAGVHFYQYLDVFVSIVSFFIPAWYINVSITVNPIRVTSNMPKWCQANQPDMSFYFGAAV